MICFPLIYTCHGKQVSFTPHSQLHGSHAYPHAASTSCSGCIPAVTGGFYEVRNIRHKVNVPACAVTIYSFVYHSVLGLVFGSHPLHEPSVAFCTITHNKDNLDRETTVIMYGCSYNIQYLKTTLFQSPNAFPHNPIEIFTS